jgi:thiol-disulfide isomerase/thioredoxin
MPLKEVQEASIDADDMTYILFFASGAPPWCPDCREALPAIESVFGKEDAPLLQVIKVGLREEWKSASNRWRGEPFQVTETPCIIKFVNVSHIRSKKSGIK